MLSRVLEKLALGSSTPCIFCQKQFCRERNGYMYPTSSRADDHSWNLLLKDLSNEGREMRRMKRGLEVNSGRPVTYMEMCHELRSTDYVSKQAAYSGALRQEWQPLNGRYQSWHGLGS